MQATSRFDRSEPRRVVRRYVAIGDTFTAGVEEGAGRWADDLADALEAVNPAVEYHNLGEMGALSAAIAATQLDRAVELGPISSR